MNERRSLGLRLIRRRVLVAISAVYLALTLALSLAYLARADRTERERFAESTTLLLDQSIERVEELFRRAQSIGETLRANPALLSILRKTYEQTSISEELEDFFALAEIQNSLLFVENAFDVRLWIDNDAIYTRERLRFFSTRDLQGYLDQLPSPSDYATADWRLLDIRDRLAVVALLPLVDLMQFPTQIGYVSVEFGVEELDILFSEITDELGGAVTISLDGEQTYSVGEPAGPSQELFRAEGIGSGFAYVYETRYPSRGPLDVPTLVSLGVIWIALAAAFFLIGWFVANERGRHLRAEMEAQLAHIDPHFLYNTLDAIAWEARQAKADELHRMISLVSTYYRRTHSPGSFTATINEEISAIRVFLDIQILRSDVNCDVEIAIDEDTGSTSVPKMLLQPIVENAFAHGVLERDVGGGRISVTASTSGDYRCLRVTDNGPGMSQEKVERLNRGEVSRGGTGGYGIASIRERIRLHYGPRARVEIASSPGIGTTVTLRLPS